MSSTPASTPASIPASANSAPTRRAATQDGTRTMHRLRLSAIPVLLAAATVALVGCSGSGGTTTATAPSATPSATPVGRGGPNRGPGGMQRAPGTSGTVAAVETDRIEVQNPSFGQVTVTFSASTRFSRTVEASVSSVAAGDCVQAIAAGRRPGGRAGAGSEVPIPVLVPAVPRHPPTVPSPPPRSRSSARPTPLVPARRAAASTGAVPDRPPGHGCAPSAHARPGPLALVARVATGGSAGSADWRSAGWSRCPAPASSSRGKRAVVRLPGTRRYVRPVRLP